MDESKNMNNEPILEMFIFETSNLIEQIEEILIKSEKSQRLSEEHVNEIFRIMHTMKGSAGMMSFSNIAKLAHSMEDLFYYVREKKIFKLDMSTFSDKILNSLDFIKDELEKLRAGLVSNGDENKLVEDIKSYLGLISSGLQEEANQSTEHKDKINSPKVVEKTEEKIALNKEVKKKESKDEEKKKKKAIELDKNINKYVVKVTFEEDCQMENIRAFTIVHNLTDICESITYTPDNLIDDSEGATKYILNNGFTIFIDSTKDEEEIKSAIAIEIFAKSIKIKRVNDFKEYSIEEKVDERDEIVKETTTTDVNSANAVEEKDTSMNTKQSIISVNVGRLDKLMDVVGEIVITESMVIKNKDLAGLKLDNFNKAAMQLRKLTDELQDIVMTIRMLPISIVFSKMNRIVRDMSRKLEKEVELEIIGEETEVDKNIIDNLSDPIMHIIRNSMDHGIESKEERINKNKNEKGKITLEARNTSGEVVIKIIDDGAGLDKKKILEKAKKNGLLTKDESELTDKEIYGLVFLPGFSTNEEITEYSGRGVGMDVVKKNIEKVGGSVFIESTPGIGTTMNIKLPLTLAIVDGMEIRVGRSVYTLPTASVKESFKLNEENLIVDTEGNEMVMVRGNCYPIIRMHKMFNVKEARTNIGEGIIIMAEADDKTICLFADELIGEQQVVVKPLPPYLSRYIGKESGIAGCTILGDGNISLILDSTGLVNRVF